MRKRTILIVLTRLFIDKTLTILSFVSCWMLKLLNFVMSVLAVRIIARSQFTLYMAVSYFMWISSFIALIVKESTTGQFMNIRKLLTIGTKLSLKSFELKSKKLISFKLLDFIFMIINTN